MTGAVQVATAAGRCGREPRGLSSEQDLLQSVQRAATSGFIVIAMFDRSCARIVCSRRIADCHWSSIWAWKQLIQ